MVVLRVAVLLTSIGPVKPPLMVTVVLKLAGGEVTVDADDVKEPLKLAVGCADGRIKVELVIVMTDEVPTVMVLVYTPYSSPEE